MHLTNCKLFIGYQAIRITGAVLGKISISVSFCTIYIASTEVLPTIIRYILIMIFSITCAALVLTLHTFVVNPDLIA